MKGETGYYRGKSPLIERFIHAFRGVGYAWGKEPNFRIEALIALAVLGAAVIFPLSGIERAILVLMVTLVLAFEIINSIFERLLDVIHPDFSPEIKRIKDTMAGVVLVVSGAALIVAGLVLVRPFFALDLLFQSGLDPFRSGVWIMIARFVTLLGDWQVFLVLVILFSSILIYQKRYMLFGFFFGSVVTGEILILILKFLFSRDRPGGPELVEVTGYSFPSGHVFLGTIFWLAAGYIITRGNEEKRYLWLVPGIIIPLIALSRVVLSVHWFSDVVAGFLFGLFWMLLWYGINKRLFRKK